ncbi:DNA-deoxyinosine glycosylase [Bifidobacterium sp. B4001]|uniref:DNA-deoxyinosine glycosylase n=1 Tax=unclassified Bifidobacterium TaxID=2608897 RepID=UPI00226BB0C7|nr:MULTISPECIES: DNA-deoxyinosine glycosylase [unclassified Bifidobacterium]MCX8672030.1 DNA-deoxyinosine glycosylase [Bifidobacterium sp. B4079]MCX8680464.1 DNA-deoxyinosine glycosylase [Bifidobacterium sp. B4001]
MIAGSSTHVTHVTHGFGPVWNDQSRVLILGSIPSPSSREAGFYYMFPRNRFWPVLAALFDQPVPEPDPAVRARFALNHRIALWDVVQECDICGASDASITGVVPTDIADLLDGAPIGTIFTTGRKAGQLYRRYCLQNLEEKGHRPTMINLPSTSPANAAMSLADLIKAYQPVRKALDNEEPKRQDNRIDYVK